jgi:hypothetical protein
MSAIRTHHERKSMSLTDLLYLSLGVLGLAVLILRRRPELGPITLWLGRQILGALRGTGGTALHDEIVLLNDLLASTGKTSPSVSL